MTKINSTQPCTTHNHVQSPSPVSTRKQPAAQIGNSYGRGGSSAGAVGNVRPPRSSVTRSISGTPEAGSLQPQRRAAAAQSPALDSVRQGDNLLRNGSRGPQVEALQNMLNRAGAQPPLETDGRFGPLTQAAVREFQTKKGIQIDGIVGPQTMAALDGKQQAGPANPNRPANPTHDHGHTHGPTAPGNPAPQGTSNADAYERGRNIGRIQVTQINGKPVELRTAQAFQQMRDAAARDGVNINIVSGFRSNAEQADLYRRYQNGTGNLAARPGYSNHQNGRALDLNTSDSRVLNWLNQNASRFGFARTVPSEPWHWEHRH